MNAASKPGVTKYATPTDTQVTVTRVFDAPRTLVYDAWTKPEHIRQWLLGPPGWSMPICEFDARVGGKWRYVYKQGDGAEMTLSGTVKEITPPSRIVSTETWGPEWPETQNMVTFDEAAGQTTVVITVTYVSKEARDAALQTGMKEGMDAGMARLDAFLSAMA